MSPVDEIRAAIDKLTKVRDEPQPPYFDRWNEDDFSCGNLDDAVEEGFSYGRTYGEWHALHATIDAQMAILEAAVGGGHDDPTAVACAFVLAEAINGPTS